ncbi:phenazine biosynthesis FMN-dependent oxidase PhzG [Actinocrispum wychmicini]|uniref:Pyridoxamine 5'-phosphate oxidase n=1 Tax=Actinocrispum wychmicini TaxID=1213861 RepID=A0A4R2J896_9PSEU|nr:phenazine biosynthesis FMN-dependent oxidase PhzG [Actinocrispum wychmicini]TCO52856.1 pyridoxamine 5'-phosphate oxidase [Actinocrispum wychmicini]
MTSSPLLTSTEFDDPPDYPVALVKSWFATAKEAGVREPGAVALATVGAAGQVSNRTVQTIRFTDTGWIFTSHAGSQKGRDLDVNNWASAVFYWRETGQQMIIAGPVHRLTDSECDGMWFARHPSTHPMSVAAEQSALLTSEVELRARAEQLAMSGEPLDRPQAWLGYEMELAQVEFWQASQDRLHRRLRYDRDGQTWTSRRLQP